MAFSQGFHTALIYAAAGTLVGAVIAFFGIRNPAPVGATAATQAEGVASSCPIDGPSLRHGPVA